MTHISLILRGLLSIAFIAAGGAKLAGVGMMVETFETIGIGHWFRYVTGSIELIGVAMLWLPNRQVFGASVLGGTMVGAVLTHWVILGPSSMPAIILGLIAASVIYIYRIQLPVFLTGRLVR